MRKLRIIPRLDIKGPNLIKGVQFEGLRVLGEPAKFSQEYYSQDADELLYIDTVASLYERNNILDIVRKTAEKTFIPMTVGGGIRSVDDAYSALRAGADKVAVNTGAVKDPSLITRIADCFGSQCMVLSVEAKKVSQRAWEAYTDNGRERTGLDVVEWVKQAQKLGAGEILLTSVDRDGTKNGFDIDLVKQVTDATSIPVIASGGMGSIEHLTELLQKTDVDAVAIASTLHRKSIKLSDIRKQLRKINIEVRLQHES